MLHFLFTLVIFIKLYKVVYSIKLTVKECGNYLRTQKNK